MPTKRPMTKTAAARKSPVTATKVAVKRPAPRRPDPGVVVAGNDQISEAIADIVPESQRGTDRYLDVVQWNIEWFGARKSEAKDVVRKGLVFQILKALNADLFVFQEVAGPSADGRYPGSLDDIAQALTDSGAGNYAVYYTKAGGEQRVAMMYDRDWVRAKTDVEELFPRGTHEMPDGKDAFAGRTPLHGYFTARSVGAPNPNGGVTSSKFDFQALGVHLKAMGEGAPQRLASAQVLADWLKRTAPLTDSDAMIMGDWNAAPDDECWAPIQALEADPESGVKFQSINDPSDFSYLWLKNRSDSYVSRIDLTAMTLSSARQVVGDAARVVRWKPIEEVIARTGDMTSTEARRVMNQLKDQVSDHLPTLSRFYFTV
ncbi:MAG: endonuclease/exonuclease/phosphatase family protein [Verrucomicrobia bacterium]|nr:endonuclease/exonuclease/phosphatase family protein [Verrucomicrobiota bacterium]